MVKIYEMIFYQLKILNFKKYYLIIFNKKINKNINYIKLLLLFLQ